jgi:hypothetical protein
MYDQNLLRSDASGVANSAVTLPPVANWVSTLKVRDNTKVTTSSTKAFGGVDFTTVFTFGAAANLDLGIIEGGGGIEVDFTGIRDGESVGVGHNSRDQKVIRHFGNLGFNDGLFGGGIGYEKLDITNSDGTKELVKNYNISLFGITYSKTSENLTKGISENKVGLGINLKEGGIMGLEFELFVPFTTTTTKTLKQ